MSLAPWRRGETWTLTAVLVQVAFWTGFCGLAGVQAQTVCPEYMCRTPSTTFVTMHNGDQPCYTYGTALRARCQIGFHASTDEYLVVCHNDGTWKWTDSCKIDVLTVIIAALAAIVVICIFTTIVYLLIRISSRKYKARELEREVDGTAQTE